MTCPLCDIPINQKEQVLWENEQVYIMANNNPYKLGHIMVVPKKHTDKLYKLNTIEKIVLMETVSFATKTLEEKTDIKGMNIGMNLGDHAGGSIPNHLHIHIVPRRENDMGFIEIIPSNTINARMYDKNNYLEYFNGFFN